MNGSATRLAWRTTPELCLNDESLVDVITGLRAQVQAIEKNELLSGAALPTWLIKALADVASNVDAVVECQALKDQVESLQKEVLELRHEMLLNVSSGNTGAAYNPTPHHRQSTGRSRAQNSSRSLMQVPSSKDLSDAFDSNSETGSLLQTTISGVSAQYVEAVVKPLWDFVHKQTNDFSALKQAFQETKDTVNRLQSEIKRRDAVIKARNEKHEDIVQSQMDKLNENLRTCISRNELVSAEQRIVQQIKSDRLRTLEEVEAKSNKILEDMLTVRSDQEDINSSTAEMIEQLTRKQGRTEEIIIDYGRTQDTIQERIEELKTSLIDTTTNLELNVTAVNALEEKVTGFEETQKIADYLLNEVTKAFHALDELKAYLEDQMVSKIAESVAVVRGEVTAVQAVVSVLVNSELDREIKAIASKLESVALIATDSVRNITEIQKEILATDGNNKVQFSQAFNSIERLQQSLCHLSDESVRFSRTLQHTIESADKLTSDVNKYKTMTDGSITTLQTFTFHLRSDHEKLTQSIENQFETVKSQLFHFEEVTSTHKREIETTQREVDKNVKNQNLENQAIKGSLDSLYVAKREMMARQDGAEAQTLALQAENRTEIQAATAKLSEIVDKESNRVEALYASFQQKQEHFADVVARSSLRNMDLADMNREIDRVCETFVTECWKFETSARSSSKHGARPTDNNRRKPFNDRQQQLLVHDCQFIADLIVARAEYEALQTGCNKDVRDQQTMDADMLEQQRTILEKIRVKVHTKIMNNKNIGEQFDKSMLDRRELYVETINNMMLASIKRRTLVGVDTTVQVDTVPTKGVEFIEATRSVRTAPAAKNVIRRKAGREGISVTAPGLHEETSSSRPTVTPNAKYIFRAGFRLPKSSTATSALSADDSTLSSSHLDVESTSESRLRFSETAGEGLQGWSTDDEGTMAKSFSLPVLKQQ